MDKALMREREAFRKKAFAATLEVKKRSIAPPTSEPVKKKVNKAPPTTDPSSIVRHMKTRHQDGESHPLSIDEILDETNQLNAGPKVKQWLITEALPHNPKVQDIDGKYLFKPPLPVRDRKSLLKLLRQHDMKGHGGVLLDDIQESLPHCDKVMRQLDKEILRIIRQTDKKQIIFYHDKGINFPVEKEFQQLWRNTSGIKSMQDTGPKVKPIRRKVRKNRARATKISDNEHMQHVLQNYDAP
ncbi:Transcription initiation factor IIE subunit beta-like [Homarus americanus]|uniref:Transcription initiation factor IIE subunit beta-like n=1 Tax=Homarus americanus TaxID=6706 RepID=A0A8J5K044_HOMAM|nr:Transcription initiation factor IIE subunit beta-like [Homarus americanus]